MTDLLLFRHGEVSAELSGSASWSFCGPRYDLRPLSLRGVQQVESVAPRLAAARPRCLVSSPYVRTLQSASILAHHLRIPVRVEPALHDWLPARDPAHWPTVEELRQKALEYDAYVRTGACPDTRTWETPDEVLARVRGALDRHRYEGAVVVVTHELVIQLLTGVLEVPLAAVIPLRWE
jgi:broad specificity phosphatase PhoE